MLKSWLTALILMGMLTACGRKHTDIQTAISQACPSLKRYSEEKLCVAAAEAEAIRNFAPVTMELLVDSKVLRDQSRVCHGIDIPKTKRGAKCKLPPGYVPPRIMAVPLPTKPAPGGAKPRDSPAAPGI